MADYRHRGCQRRPKSGPLPASGGQLSRAVDRGSAAFQVVAGFDHETGLLASVGDASAYQRYGG